jgi:hypothetical protein
MRRSVLAILTLSAAVLSLNLYPDQAATAQSKQESLRSEAPAVKINITGKVIKDSQGYSIRGKRPAEIFTILNPNPEILDKIVKSGRLVTIEATSVVGDNVKIEKIDGKSYPMEKGSKQ